MSFIKTEDNKKWINAFVAVCAILGGYLTIQFVEQVGEWFDLEAKVPYFLGVSQGMGIVVGLIIFMVVRSQKTTREYLDEVYAELVKVIWPESESVVKSTIGILIGLAIVSTVFVGVDFLFRKALELLY